MSASERTLQICKEIETDILLANSEEEMNRLLTARCSEGWARVGERFVLRNEVVVQAVIREDAEYMSELIEKCKGGPLQVLPNGMRFEPIPPIATQAKYFHYAEVDGQKAMIGFQTYEELRLHFAGGESMEGATSDPLHKAEEPQTVASTKPILMKLYEITNKLIGESYIRAYAWAESAEQAASMYMDRVKGTKHEGLKFIGRELFYSSFPPFCTTLTDYGWPEQFNPLIPHKAG